MLESVYRLEEKHMLTKHSQQMKLQPVYSKSLGGRIKDDFKRNWTLYLLVLPVFVYYVIFMYLPMFGIVIAFQDFKFSARYNFIGNILHSDFVLFDHFKSLFSSIYFKRVFSNTVRIGVITLVCSFPVPIILAIMMNELRNEKYKKTTQVMSYLPHFISMVVVCGMIKDFTSDKGFITIILSAILGKEPTSMLNDADLFLPVYVISGIWQNAGWGAIIYTAALSGVDQSLYEAAAIDGAGRWKQTLHVTLPSILPTIVIMLILETGSVLNVSYEKILLLYNELTKSKAEVINTFVYQRGLINRDWSFSTAVSLFNSIISIIMVLTVNKICNKLTETSLW